jgi:hypothetical protein
VKNRKGPKDPESMAAMEIVAMEQRQDAMAEATKGAREKAASVLFREAGRIEAMNYQRAQADFFMLIMLKRVKEAKEYREKLDMTWPQFCEAVGVKWRTIDDKLADIKPFKEEFLTAFVNFSGFELNKIRLIGEAISNGAVKIEGTTIIYDGQKIAITPENKDEIQGVFEKIETTYKKDLDDAQSEVRASKRVLKDKETLINKQAKLIDRYTGNARNKDLTPEEDGFLQQMENLKIGFDGYMLQAEPERIEELRSFAAPRDEETGLHPPTDVSPRMRAAYLETLGYMRRQITAAYDTAVEMYGHDMALDGEKWEPGK